MFKHKHKAKVNKTVNTGSDLILNLNPKSQFTESIKLIRTNLAFSSINKELKLLAVTSPEPSDGKSFVTANLALAYAEEGKKVLLIDADMRRGRQHNIFEIDNSNSAGYSNMILKVSDKKFKMDDFIVKSKKNKVDVLPCGPTPPNPVELLSSENNVLLLDKLKEIYDIVLIDCPPIVGISDALIVSQYTDANLVVISNKKTKEEELTRVVKSFAQAGSQITGVILNKVEKKSRGYYGYYTSSYYD